MGMMLSAPAGNDILFDEALCEQGRNFNNKIWNCFRLIKGWQVADVNAGDGVFVNRIATAWMDAKLKQANEELADHFSKYRINDALMTVYKLFWDEFSSWYLEMIKPTYGQPIDRETYDKTLAFFDTLLKMLHPFMPFITEELWQALYERKEGESIMRQQLRLDAPTDEERKLIADIELMKQVVAGVRAARNQRNIAPKEQLTLQCVGECCFTPYIEVVKKMAGLSEVATVKEKDATSAAFLVGTYEIALPLGQLVNAEEEIEKMEAQLKHLEGFLAGVKKKLSNERFVANAPEAVVAMERKKQADSEEKIATLRQSIEALKASR
jgi:valyl-tRNA synthetase